MCKASIIIPAYNSSQYVAKTIESILAQTFTDFECIVIDDGSRDDTLAIINSYKDSRIVVISLPNSGGPAIPRNTGLSAAKGEYIFMFDSDDIMHPQKLELSIAALEKNLRADILFTNFASIDEQDKIIKPDFLHEYDSLWALVGGKPETGTVNFIESQKIYPALVKVNFIGTSSVVLRKSSLSALDVFNESLKNSDDRLFWILFTKHHDAIYLHSILHQYRIQSNSISNQGFIRRGPSKIEALKIVFNLCQNKNLKRELISQISNDYATLAYAYGIVNRRREQRTAALSGLKWGVNLRLIKILLKSFL